jgi:phage repressor protein C with HTH and peptisase S24 domain
MTPPSDDEMTTARVGRALARLRRRASLTQAAAAERMSMTPQAWQRYERGERQLLLRSDMQARVARAVNATRDELLTEARRGVDDDAQPPDEAPAPAPYWAADLQVIGRVRAGAPGDQVYDEGAISRTVSIPQLIGKNCGVLELAGESMLPWGEPGEIIIYDRDRYPRRGYGCVIETASGEYYVKFYNRTSDGMLYVDQLQPAQSLEFPLSAIRGVYAVRLRGD